MHVGHSRAPKQKTQSELTLRFQVTMQVHAIIMQGIVTQLIKYILKLFYHLPSVTCKFLLIHGN